ncbi:MAG: HAD family hydrolase [Rhodospirillales bacterium]|nr:HAD family hydrolase [Rhodospirillales bacterium]
MTALSWLPDLPDFRARLAALAQHADPWAAAMALATHRLDFLQTNALAATAARLFPTPPPGLASQPIRLAVLGSATTTHLLTAIRTGGLRHGLWLDLFEPAFGQILQALHDPASSLHRFAPHAVLFSFDARHLTAGIHPGLDDSAAESAIADRLDHITRLWERARTAFACPVLQQTALPVLPRLMGSNEHRLAGAPAQALARINAGLTARAAAAGVHLLAIDARAAQDGLAAWHDPALWHRSRQEIRPDAAPIYGDMLARLLAALQGRARKCLVLDLDNTIWGGVIGDDGPDGIVLGPGSAAGEGFLAVQAYAKALAQRGVILAVCSKNEAANALAVFDTHPEMILRRSDIACFQANWQDKASNLRAIAGQLRIGLDALVMLDDNPAERALIRRELPMVAVPEPPEEAARVPGCLADAGYFEALAITVEDRARTGQYRQEHARAALRETATDLAGFLHGLEMRMTVHPFEDATLPRIAQLINKTNQFNLTTRRYAEERLRAMRHAADWIGLCFRLRDRFGDHGIIAVAILQAESESLRIDTWLMSCRVLGRQVEEAMLGVLLEEARRRGARRLLGAYVPSARNAMVREHYPKLGFTACAPDGDGAHRWVLDLAAAAAPASAVRLEVQKVAVGP